MAPLPRPVPDQPTASLACTAPPWLPHYDLDIHIDVQSSLVTVRQRVTWTNHHQRPTEVLVFNNHSHYSVPEKDLGLLAKTVEILRLAPSDAIDLHGPPCTIHRARLVNGSAPPVPIPVNSQPRIGTAEGTVTDLPFTYWPNNATALEVKLPYSVGPGQSVSLDLDFTLRLPQRQGRWGQWRGVTFLAQWLPVLAVYDDSGWQQVPFIPWHQLLFNEAGVYRAVVRLPADQKLGHTGSVAASRCRVDGWQEVQIREVVARDFSLFCSANFVEAVGQAGPVKVRVLHLPEHAFHGKEMLRIACEALPLWTGLFGPFPYPEFTVVESYFGWNGNECGGVVMIDERVCGMPSMAVAFIDALLTHEVGHQWFYNAVGTNGYCETFMDEAVISHYTHKLMDRKVGKNNSLLNWPTGLKWLPSIGRHDYRNYGIVGAIGRCEVGPAVQPMEKYGHLVNLMAATYDRGGRIIGMIEARLGEPAMVAFMRGLYRKYYFRILRVTDFQRELEAYTQRSWQEFFDQWVYGAGMTDWCVADVQVAPLAASQQPGRRSLLGHWADKLGLDSVFHQRCKGDPDPCQVTVVLKQKGANCEPTVLGISLDGSDCYQLRLPLVPGEHHYTIDDPPALVEPIDKNCLRVTVTLPCRPTQISVDPDKVLMDCEPLNNHWKTPCRFTFTPLYFMLNETDLTNAHDELNFNCGPWLFGPLYNDPWYTRSTMFGLRAGVYRTQQYYGGGYLAYRANDRNIVAGVDGLLDHWPFCRTQVGFNIERRLTNVQNQDGEGNRATIYARYVFLYGSSMYLPPFEHVEVFASYQDDRLPSPRVLLPGQQPFDEQTALGVHYHKYYLTPYWDPEGGIALDAVYRLGLPVAGSESFNMAWAQATAVKYFPDPFHLLQGHPVLEWLADTRFAGRLFLGAASPQDGRFFTLGGGDLFRGFDIRERQGSAMWLASLEWRVPIWKGLRLDLCDHIAGVRNVYGAAFYDVGGVYHEGQPVKDVAHAVGVGLRVDVAWFGLIERSMLRLDAAQALGEGTPMQFWFGIAHPF